MHRLADLIHRRAKTLLALTVVLTLAAGVAGGGVVGSLSTGGSSDPAMQSAIAGRELAAATRLSPQPSLLVLVRTKGPVLGARGRELMERVITAMRRQAAIGAVRSALNEHDSRTLLARGEKATLVLGFFRAHSSEQADTSTAVRLARQLHGLHGVTVGGDQLTYSQLEETISAQLPRVELIAFSILLVLALIAFRSLVAAALPLAVGAIAVAGSLLVMRALAQLTPLSIYSLNLVTGLGLGLAIDYSLFMVYRYREELARHGHCREALERTLQTAGRTVAFSSLTVSVALLSLLVFPQPMLSSMGIAAALVTVLAATAALIPLGALLTVLGPRVNALAPARLQRARQRAEGPAAGGRWYRLAMSVTRRPALVAGGCAVLLTVVGLPALQLRLGSTNALALAPASAPRIVESFTNEHFAAEPANPIVAVIHAPSGAGSALARYTARLARLPGAAVVEPARLTAAKLWRIDVLPRHGPLSESSQRLVGEVRSLRSPYPVALTGAAAAQSEEHLSLAAHIPLALAILAASTLLVLFMMSGSVVLALKSLLMNMLTLSGAFGALVFIFQDGRLQNLLGYTATGSLEQTNMIILFIIAFGLSTDYGVFLLARIKEAHETGASDRVAVATGLQRSGQVVTAAALLFCAAVGSLAYSSVPSLKEFGIGAALAVLIDATIVRALLVPSLMALLGRANWWAPRGLRALTARSWAHPAEVLKPAERPLARR